MWLLLLAIVYLTFALGSAKALARRVGDTTPVCSGGGTWPSFFCCLAVSCGGALSAGLFRNCVCVAHHDNIRNVLRRRAQHAVLLPDLQLRGSLTPSQDDADWDTDRFEVRGVLGCWLSCQHERSA